mmetsp:Transcript_64162/g.167928  ORF Transcript_64162/g.167928 Transcript_64162/m.167928 type:complete len:262 (+) Transcript_64162:30-815(+)
MSVTMSPAVKRSGQGTPMMAAPVVVMPARGPMPGSMMLPAGCAPVQQARAAPLPDPASIEEQKQAYSRSLDLQLEQGNASLKAQNDERKRQLTEEAEKRKAAVILQIDQAMKLQEMALDEQTHQAMLSLKQAFFEQRAALDHQAASLTLEYQQRKMQEEFVATQNEMQKQYMENHEKLHTEARKFAQENAARLGEVGRSAGGHIPVVHPAYAARAGMPATNGYGAPQYGLSPATSYVSMPAYGSRACSPRGAFPPPQVRQG